MAPKPYEFFYQVAYGLERLEKRPHGPEPDPDTKRVAGEACIQFCGGDHDRARSLWKLIQDDLGYMPRAACVALIRASSAENLVPDVEAPPLS